MTARSGDAARQRRDREETERVELRRRVVASEIVTTAQVTGVSTAFDSLTEHIRSLERFARNPDFCQHTGDGFVDGLLQIAREQSRTLLMLKNVIAEFRVVARLSNGVSPQKEDSVALQEGNAARFRVKDKSGTYVPPHRRQANSVPSVCPVVVGEHPPPRTEEGIRLKGVIYAFDIFGWIQCNDPLCAETGNWFCFHIDSIIGNGDIGGNRDTMKYLKGLQVEFNIKCFDEDTTPLPTPRNLGPRPLTSDLAQLEELRLYQERGVAGTRGDTINVDSR